MTPPAASDPRVDDYIAKAAPFAQPVLAHLRAAVHAALPEVEETIKWGMPFFMLDGRPFANMAAFKAHCAFGFWKDARAGVQAAAAPAGEAMGQFGRIGSKADLPPAATLRKLLQAAAREARTAAHAPAAPRPGRAALALPDDFAAALRAQPAAQAAFDAFAPGRRREYIEWVTEARRPETRARRLEQAVAWIAEGKTRNWKYEHR